MIDVLIRAGHDALAYINHVYWDSVLWNWTIAIAGGTCAELLFAAERGQPIRNWLLNIRYGVVYGLLIFFLTPSIWMAIAKICTLTGTGMFDLRIGADTVLQAIAASLLTFLITDFFYYWMHRMQHMIPILWAQHSLHHSEPSLNMTTGFRHHWLELFLQAIFIILPMTILFQLSYVAGVIGFIFSLWSFFIHANLRLSLGPLAWVIVGPQGHRIHHSLQAQHLNKNFAAYFAIWDVIFGTFWAPRPGEYPATGLTTGEVPRSALRAIIWPVPFWLNHRPARSAPA
jgi:sterol desaturase/sphingolipid hydroxylase (fatty acid hydroxylase superfamily)